MQNYSWENMKHQLTAKMPLLAQHLAITSPDKVYQYTSADALISIVKNNELWCTDSRFLNDTTERTHAYELMQERLKMRLESGPHTVSITSFLERCYKYIAHEVVDMPVFIASFTEKADALSQWRAYCPATGGYAIGLPASGLASLCNADNMTFAKCIYDPEVQICLIEELITAMIGLYQSISHNPDECYDDDASIPSLPHIYKVSIVHTCIQELTRIAPLMKHDGFQEEQEWRLIIHPKHGVYTFSEIPQLNFRAGQLGVIPYYILNLSLPDGEQPSSENRELLKSGIKVMIGPCLNPVQRLHALKPLFSMNDALSQLTQFEQSKIPYRS